MQMQFLSQDNREKQHHCRFASFWICSQRFQFFPGSTQPARFLGRVINKAAQIVNAECVRWCFWLRLCLSSGVVSSIMNQNLGLAPLVLNAYPHIWSTRGFFKQHKQRCFKKPLWHQTPQKISDSASFVRRVPRFAEQSKCFHIATSASVSCSYLSRSATLGCPHPVIYLV